MKRVDSALNSVDGQRFDEHRPKPKPPRGMKTCGRRLHGVAVGLLHTEQVETQRLKIRTASEQVAGACRFEKTQSIEIASRDWSAAAAQRPDERGPSHIATQVMDSLSDLGCPHLIHGQA